MNKYTFYVTANDMKLFTSRGKRQHLKFIVADYDNSLKDRVYLNVIGDIWWVTITTVIDTNAPKSSVAFDTLCQGANIKDDIELIEIDNNKKTPN